jgi:hypothetical protein
MNRRHQERQESQERLIPPPLTSRSSLSSSSHVPVYLTLPATTSVKLLSEAEKPSHQRLLSSFESQDSGSRVNGGRKQRSVGFSIDGNIYHYCDYSKKGFLLDVFQKHGEKGLNREFKLMIPFMYCSGKGLTIKESCVDFNYSQQLSKDHKKKKSSSGYADNEDDRKQKEPFVDNFLVRKTFTSFNYASFHFENTCRLFLFISRYIQKLNDETL